MDSNTTSFKDHFSSLANEYSRYRPRYPEELFRYLSTLAPRHDLALDCATGNGQAAHGLAPFFNRIIATDASAQQIAHAYPHERITYAVASAEHSPAESSSVDLVTIAAAIHWVEFEKFYAEVNRVLRPGGIFAAWSYLRSTISPDIDRVCEKYREIIHEYWPPERQYVEEEYRTIPFPFDEIVPPSFTLHQEWTMNELIGYWETWSASKKYLEHNNVSPVDKIRKELETVWRDPSVKRSIRWVLFFRIGRPRI